MGNRSTALIVILVFGVLFIALALVRPSPTTSIELSPTLTEDDAANITKSDIEKQVAPMHVDKFLLYPRYEGHPLMLVYIYENGTQYYVPSGFTCSLPQDGTCNLGEDIANPIKGHLSYIVDGCWQDASVGNINHYIYAVDAHSGTILWSYIDREEIGSCPVEPPEWLKSAAAS